MIVAGLDLSLTRTGIALVSDDPSFAPVTSTVRTRPADGPVLHRMRLVVAESFAAVQQARHVVIEGLSFGSHGSATRDLAGLWWLMVDVLASAERITLGRSLAVVDPSTLKLWATGHGRASKKELNAHMSRRWHLPGPITHDEADALALASMGLHHHGGLPWAPTPAQTRAVTTPDWNVEAA